MEKGEIGETGEIGDGLLAVGCFVVALEPQLYCQFNQELITGEVVVLLSEGEGIAIRNGA